jgi:hypothetical protein
MGASERTSKSLVNSNSLSSPVVACQRPRKVPGPLGARRTCDEHEELVVGAPLCRLYPRVYCPHHINLKLCPCKKTEEAGVMHTKKLTSSLPSDGSSRHMSTMSPPATATQMLSFSGRNLKETI